MADKFQLVDVNLGKDANDAIAHYVEQQLESLISSHSELHKQKLPKWRKQYLGIPEQMTRNFPFPNAANTVVQVVGETVDTMVARVMGLIYATHPLWVFQNYAKSDSTDDKKAHEAQKYVLEQFMDIVGFEPYELDLQRIEAEWFTDAAKLGTGFVKLSVEQNIEAVVTGYTEAKIKGHEQTMYDGPRVSKLRHEDVYVDPSYHTLDLAPFVAVKRTLKRVELEERGFTEVYDKKVVESILSSPDRSSPDANVQQELQDQGISNGSRPDTTAEWDVYECYFYYWAGNPKRKYRLIYTYHRRTKTVLRKVFNFMPKNQLPVKRAKLGYRTDGMYGHGYAELLESYQEELSTTHNQRLDNATVANVRALRVSPRARSLDANMELYPAALLVGEKDEIEAIQVGDVYPSTFKNEEMTLGLVARRAGISPAVSGAGTGGMMKKPAVYSAQGTLAVMQENNSVVGFATSEFRHAHVQLGSSLVGMYAKFGVGDRGEMFGLDSERLDEALELFNKNRMRIPLRASTAALNKEVDKQTGMLMAGLLQRHYTATGQLMQAISNPVLPEQTRTYFVRVIQSADQFHKRILKDFGYEQPDIFVPDPKLPDPEQQAAGAVRQGGMAPQGAPMAGGGNAAPGGGQGMVPMPGLGGPQGGPPPMAGPSGR